MKESALPERTAFPTVGPDCLTYDEVNVIRQGELPDISRISHCERCVVCANLAINNQGKAGMFNEHDLLRKAYDLKAAA